MGRTMLRAAALAAFVSTAGLRTASAQAPGWAQPIETAAPANQPTTMRSPSQECPPASGTAHQIPTHVPGNTGTGITQTLFHHADGLHHKAPYSQFPVHHPHYVPSPVYLPPEAPGVTPTGYPYMNASMYPCPLPYIPYQVGASVITNQAFYPHEMLYPHKYRAMYAPFYYQVDGCWKVLPWGVSQSEAWRLKGTVVKVKYSPSISICSGFCPPALP